MQTIMEDGRYADDYAVDNAELVVHMDMTGELKKMLFHRVTVCFWRLCVCVIRMHLPLDV